MYTIEYLWVIHTHTHTQSFMFAIVLLIRHGNINSTDRSLIQLNLFPSFLPSPSFSLPRLFEMLDSLYTNNNKNHRLKSRKTTKSQPALNKKKKKHLHIIPHHMNRIQVYVCIDSIHKYMQVTKLDTVCQLICQKITQYRQTRYYIGTLYNTHTQTHSRAHIVIFFIFFSHFSLSLLRYFYKSLWLWRYFRVFFFLFHACASCISVRREQQKLIH